MKTIQWLAVPVFLLVAGASAARPFGAVDWRIEHDEHGPYAGKVLEGSCAVDLAGDRTEQTTRCVMDMLEPTRPGIYRRVFRMADTQARIGVANGNELRIAMGLPTAGADGTYRANVMDIRATYGSAVVLTDGATVVLGGIQSDGTHVQPEALDSTLGPYSQDNPDCLIWDIVGSDVYDGAQL